MQRQLSLMDHLILNFDSALKTLTTDVVRNHERPTPGKDLAQPILNKQESSHVAGLMRVNHTGEVCAQALYQGQALTAKLEDVKDKMLIAAQEEIDHLAWCEERLLDLNANTSYLNYAWYLMSFTMGSFAGLIGDKWSLGFVVETERQVTKHLESHVELLPKQDCKSKKILEQMIIDEMAHATIALDAGGAELPQLVKSLMTLMSKLMTTTSYYL